MFRSVINILSHSSPFVNTFFYFFQTFFDSRFFRLFGSDFANLSAFLASPLGFFLLSSGLLRSGFLRSRALFLPFLPRNLSRFRALQPIAFFPSSLSLSSPFFAASLYYHISSPFVNYFFHVFFISFFYIKFFTERYKLNPALQKGNRLYRAN